jgi:hypothetical protein
MADPSSLILYHTRLSGNLFDRVPFFPFPQPHPPHRMHNFRQ